MRRRRMLSLVVVALVAANVVTAVWLMKALRINRLWQDQLPRAVGYNAVSQAVRDFEDGKRRVYILEERELVEGGPQEGFTGRFDGPFEVWSYVFWPSMSPPDRLISEQFISTYNDRMRTMHADPQRFRHPAEEEK